MTVRSLSTRAAPAIPIGGAGGGAASTADASVLDEQCLTHLRDLDPTGQNKLLVRVFRAFEASMARLMPQFDEARRVADIPTLRLVAHTLKSSSASLGALKLSSLCAQIEAFPLDTVAGELHSGEIATKLDAMELELQAVRAEIRHLQDEAS